MRPPQMWLKMWLKIGCVPRLKIARESSEDQEAEPCSPHHRGATGRRRRGVQLDEQSLRPSRLRAQRVRSRHQKGICTQHLEEHVEQRPGNIPPPLLHSPLSMLATADATWAFGAPVFGPEASGPLGFAAAPHWLPEPGRQQLSAGVPAPQAAAQLQAGRLVRQTLHLAAQQAPATGLASGPQRRASRRRSAGEFCKCTTPSISRHVQAYRREALKWHPDKNTDRKEAAERRFKEISDAYRLLSDPDERAHFDRYGGRTQQQQRRPQQQYGGGGHMYAEELTPEDIFNMFFGTQTGAQHRQQRRRQPQYNPRADGPQMNLSLFQILPVAIMFSILSSAAFSSDSQSFGLQQSTNMPIERRTLRMGALPTPPPPAIALCFPPLRVS